MGVVLTLRENLMANFSTESWWGPESLHYEAEKQELLGFKAEETDPNVNRWIERIRRIVGPPN
jgi:hypothetical protein